MIDTNYPFTPETIAGQFVAAIIDQSKTDSMAPLLRLTRELAYNGGGINDNSEAVTAEINELLMMAEYLNQERVDGSVKEHGSFTDFYIVRDFLDEMMAE